MPSPDYGRVKSAFVLKLKSNSKGLSFRLLAIYGPSEDDPAFFVKVVDELLNYHGKIISIGDYNVKREPEKDVKPYRAGRKVTKKANFLFVIDCSISHNI